MSLGKVSARIGSRGANVLEPCRHDQPVHTFAILGSRRPEDAGASPIALSALGPALAVESCEGFEVRVLPQGADARIHDQLRASRRNQD